MNDSPKAEYGLGSVLIVTTVLWFLYVLVGEIVISLVAYGLGLAGSTP